MSIQQFVVASLCVAVFGTIIFLWPAAEEAGAKLAEMELGEILAGLILAAITALTVATWYFGIPFFAR